MCFVVVGGLLSFFTNGLYECRCDLSTDPLDRGVGCNQPPGWKRQGYRERLQGGEQVSYCSLRQFAATVHFVSTGSHEDCTKEKICIFALEFFLLRSFAVIRYSVMWFIISTNPPAYLCLALFLTREKLVEAWNI